jgi:hypothetical protein
MPVLKTKNRLASQDATRRGVTLVAKGSENGLYGT